MRVVPVWLAVAPHPLWQVLTLIPGLVPPGDPGRLGQGEILPEDGYRTEIGAEAVSGPDPLPAAASARTGANAARTRITTPIARAIGLTGTWSRRMVLLLTPDGQAPAES